MKSVYIISKVVSLISSQGDVKFYDNAIDFQQLVSAFPGHSGFLQE